jgi:hypothetical protein
MAKKKSSKIPAPDVPMEIVRYSEIRRWRERAEEVRVRAATCASLIQLKNEIYNSKQNGAGESLDWYTDFYKGTIDDAIRFLSHGAEAEMGHMETWLESLDAEMAHG